MSTRPGSAPRAHELDVLMRRYALEAERLGRSFCRTHDLHPTDFQALGMIMEAELVGEPLTPRALADALSLTTGATSAAIDRLERSGHVTRRRESHDRRLVHLHYTDVAMAVGREFFAPLGERTAQVRARYTPEQLEAVASYIAEMTEAVRAHREQYDDAAADGSGA